ncbi:DEAD/DEAH box helicase [Chondromyces crocatus]|uniref:DEAD/DEAH box helicase n=1 Tax=Chondromyces crocatus TaxID=52 RepID=A0A0K1EH79_CHOCO|nr:DEAD/DEAH box helicase [Chondromyces crocatus]AKT40221.1 DEAD/DEAH box helicase [Chondromyces crocatus]
MDNQLGPLEARITPTIDPTPDELLNGFLEYITERELELYPAQEEAILELFAGKNVILNTPTGSGKSLVATALHYKALCENRRSFYTCPIKALVSEKFFALCKDFGASNVGMMTGDASVNRDAPILCCTAEILANIALREGEKAPVDYVIMDEFHYYSDRERGVAWQIPLLTLPKATFLLMSATLGNVDFFQEKLSELTGIETAIVRSSQRPVPLDYEYRETALHETVAHLIKTGRAPIYIVNFTQRAAAEEAQNLMSQDFCTKEEKRAINAALAGVKFASPYGREVQRFLRHGIGLHHAGLLPRYRLLVEKLAQQGHLRIISGTDTLGVGVNIPIRTVLFTRLCKFDGEKTAILSVRDFQQISGRAGRKGFDDHGTVVAQAPEHVIENLRMEIKAGNDPAKRRKIVRRKPPERGYVHWDRQTFERLVASQPEPLVSRFQVSHGMLLNVLGRKEGGCQAMKKLVRSSHERPAVRRQIGKTAMQLLRSLWEAGIVELVPMWDSRAKKLEVSSGLQEEFSLHQALSLYVLETVDKLDRELGTYPLDVLTLVESTLENPEAILQRQLDKVKQLKLAELKAEGVEYEQRIEALEKLEYPKPNREFIYLTFDDFGRRHPWVGQENIRPKGIAREMYEKYMSFADFIKEYGLERVEGLLLRYLSDVYKGLVQTVPDYAKNDDVDEMIAYFRALVRGVDSSLLDEWERLRAGGAPRVIEAARGVTEPEAFDITRDERAFTVLLRNELFFFLRALASRDYEVAAEMVEGEGEPWTAARLEATLQAYYAEHTAIRTDPVARRPQNTLIERSDDGTIWNVKQIVVDPEDDQDWMLDCLVDLGRSRDAGRPVIVLRQIKS